MPDRTPAPSLTNLLDARWSFDLAVPAESLRLGVTMASAPGERSVVLTFEAQFGHEPVPAVTGLIWSQKIATQFTYFPGPDRTVFFSPEILFAGPIDRVRISALSWPSTEALSRQQVSRLFVRVPEGPKTDGGVALSALYLGAMEAPR